LPEVLSQNEIDALLQAISSGEANVQDMKEEKGSKKVKKYDFKNPQKIAKDQLRTLEIIHENFSRLLQTFLSGYLRAPVKIGIMTVDQYAYSEFNNAISNPAFLTIINFNPLDGQIVIDISTNIVYTMIDRLLGGDGDGKYESRGFTEIELSLLTVIMSKLNDFIKEAWSNVIDLEPSLEKIETNSQFAQIVPPNETVALITLNIEVGKVEGMINVCIPYIVIEPILDKLSTKYWFSTSKKDVSEEDEKLIKDRILDTIVPITAELGNTRVKISDIVNLTEGDVIGFDKSNNENIKVKIGPFVKFLGKLGTKNNKMAIKINKIIEEGENIYG
jgi:flagellar motor switch protein FliM